MIKTNNLCKSFYCDSREIPILKDINIEIEEGEFYSIMGPSGAGKSTLLYLLGGLDQPTSGEIYIKNQNIATMKPKEMSKMRRSDVGFVFQFYNLVPNLTVEDNIMLPILLDGKKINRYQDDLERVLEQVNLIEQRRHTPRQLSGGQQQRVAIARALIHDPSIIFADEPIGNLDSKTGEEIMELFQELNQTLGKTIVQVTHSKESVSYGTKLITVRDGKVE